MVSVLLAILHTLGVAAKSVWSFAKAKFLFLWTALHIVTPYIAKVWLANKLLRLGLILSVTYAIRTVVVDGISNIWNFAMTGITLSQLFQNMGWAGWLVWEGPMQLSILWGEIVDCLTLWGALRLASYTIRRLQFWQQGMLYDMRRNLLP